MSRLLAHSHTACGGVLNRTLRALQQKNRRCVRTAFIRARARAGGGNNRLRAVTSRLDPRILVIAVIAGNHDGRASLDSGRRG